MECAKNEDMNEGYAEPVAKPVPQPPAAMPERVLLSKALRWHMPVIGEVPLMFYIPECGEHYFNLKKLIEDHGGMVVEQHECYTFQIKPESAKLKMKDFYFG